MLPAAVADINKIIMLSVKDLRVGNFVYGINEYQNTALPICSLHSDETLRLLVGDKSIGCFSASVIKPIELDSEWLKRLGFQHDYPYFFLGNKHFNVETGFFYFGNDHVSGGNYDVKIKYVHELQNVMFALTGKELVCQ